MPIGHTQRGFADYANFTDTYGTRVLVRQSNAPAAVWVFMGTPTAGEQAAIHLDVEQARTLVAALQEWIGEQEGQDAERG